MDRCSALFACLLMGTSAGAAQVDSACSAATEARHLREAKLPDARADTVLTLAGRYRGQLVLREGAVPGAPPGATQPRFAGRLARSNLWWLRLCGPTPNQPPLAHALVSMDTTEVVTVSAAPPQVAPDGHRLALIESPSATQGAALALWQQREGGWARTFHYTTPTGLALRLLRWRGDGAALFLTWERHDATACSGPVQLRDGPYGWDWVPGLPTGACP